MLNSSLMDILRKLNPTELKELREYIQSPFFNKNRNVHKLFDYIVKQYPAFATEKMKKEYVYKKLFEKTRYNDGFMRTLIFLITKLAEDYLAYTNFIRDKYSPKLSLVQELHKREIDRILFKNLRTTEKDFVSEEVKDEKYFKAVYELQILKNDSQLLKERTLNPKELQEDLSLNILDHQVIIFLISVMNSYIFILNRKHLVDLQYELSFINEVIDHMKRNLEKYSEYPLLMILYYQLRINIDENNEYYYKKLKEIVINNNNDLNYMERYNGIIGMQNFCMGQSNRGKGEYIDEYFDIIEFVLRTGYYSSTPGGYFLPQHFKNFVIVGTNLKKYEWTENFIKTYVKKLDPGHRENAYNFSMAKIYHSKKDHEKALWYISRVSYQDLYYKLEVRYYTLMIYYELSMFSEAYDHIESYKKFIVNNKHLNHRLKNKHLAFVKYINELLKIKLSGNIKKLHTIEKNLKNSDNVLNKAWLISKLDELYSVNENK